MTSYTLLRKSFFRHVPPSLTSNGDVAIWSTIEPGLGIIAAGGATLRPLLRSFYGMTTASGGVTSTRAVAGFHHVPSCGRKLFHTTDSLANSKETVYTTTLSSRIGVITSAKNDANLEEQMGNKSFGKAGLAC